MTSLLCRKTILIYFVIPALQKLPQIREYFTLHFWRNFVLHKQPPMQYGFCKNVAIRKIIYGLISPFKLAIARFRVVIDLDPLPSSVIFRNLLFMH